MTQHEKTITTSSVGKRSPPKRLFPRNRQKGIKTKQIRYSQVLLVYWHNRLLRYNLSKDVNHGFQLTINSLLQWLKTYRLKLITEHFHFKPKIACTKASIQSDKYRFHLFITDYHFKLIKLKCHPFLPRIQSPSLRHLQHQQQFY